MKKYTLLTLALLFTLSSATLAWSHGWHGRGGHNYGQAAYGYGHGYDNGHGYGYGRGNGPCWSNNVQGPAVAPQGYAPQQYPAQPYPAQNMPTAPMQGNQPDWSGPQR